MTHSRVLEFAPEDPQVLARELRARLAATTDPSDVHADLAAGVSGLLLLDARSPEAYSRGHVPGAVNVPYRRIDATTAAELPRDAVLVTYCDGIGCNASTKAALKLATLGFKVKEMLGGLDWWIRDGYAVETGDGVGLEAKVSCGC